MDTQAFEPRNPDYAARVHESFGRQGLMTLIDAQITDLYPGACEIRLPFRADLTQQHGFFHGGILGSLADAAAGFASFSLMPADASVLTIEFKTNFLAPAKGALLIARGKVIKPGRTVTVAETHVHVLDDGTEKLCATLSATMMVVRHQPEL